MINHILAASRVPWILEQKGIDVDNLLRVNIDEKDIEVLLYRVENVMKFGDYSFEQYKEKIGDTIGRLTADYDGIKFITCVREDELSLIEG